MAEEEDSRPVVEEGVGVVGIPGETTGCDAAAVRSDAQTTSVQSRRIPFDAE